MWQCDISINVYADPMCIGHILIASAKCQHPQHKEVYLAHGCKGFSPWSWLQSRNVMAEGCRRGKPLSLWQAGSRERREETRAHPSEPHLLWLASPESTCG